MHPLQSPKHSTLEPYPPNPRAVSERPRLNDDAPPCRVVRAPLSPPPLHERAIGCRISESRPLGRDDGGLITIVPPHRQAAIGDGSAAAAQISRVWALNRPPPTAHRPAKPSDAGPAALRTPTSSACNVGRDRPPPPYSAGGARLALPARARRLLSSDRERQGRRTAHMGPRALQRRRAVGLQHAHAGIGSPSGAFFASDLISTCCSSLYRYSIPMFDVSACPTYPPGG